MLTREEMGLRGSFSPDAVSRLFFPTRERETSFLRKRGKKRYPLTATLHHCVCTIAERVILSTLLSLQPLPPSLLLSLHPPSCLSLSARVLLAFL